MRNPIFPNLVFMGKAVIFFSSLHLSTQTSSQPTEANAIAWQKKAIEFNHRGFYDSAVAYLLRCGRVYDDIGNSDKAISVYYSAKKIGDDNKIDSLRVKSLLNIAGLYSLQTEYTKAMEVSREALAICRQSQDIRAVLHGLALQRIGNCYRGVGSYYEAISYYDSARKFYEKENDKEIAYVAGLFNDRGITYYYNNEANKALKDFEMAYGLQQKLFGEADVRVGNAVMNIGNVYLEKYDHEKALVYYYKSMNIFKKVLGEDHINIAKLYHNIGDVYLETGNLTRSNEMHQQGLAITLKSLGKWTLQAAHTYSKLGRNYTELKEYKEAIQYYKQCIAITDRHQDRTFIWSSATLGLGHCYLQTGNPSQAMRLYTRVLDKYKSEKQDQGIDAAEVYSKMGDWYDADGNFTAAIEAYQNAIDRLITGSSKRIEPGMDISNIADTRILLQSIYGRAKTMVNYSRQDPSYLVKALDGFGEAVILTDLMQNPVQGEASRMELLELARDMHHDYINACFLLYAKTNEDQYMHTAFRIAEKSKAVILRENLWGMQSRKMAGIPAHISDREDELKREMLFCRMQLSDESLPDSAKLSFRNKILLLTAAYEKFRDTLEKQFGSYYNLKYNNEVTDLPGLQMKLPDSKTAIINYIVSEKEIRAFVITKNKIVFRGTMLLSDLDSLIFLLRGGASSSAILNDKGSIFAGFTSAASQLYRQLFDFIKPFIPADIARLVIIPGGSLSYIPFEVLLTDAVPAGLPDYTRLPYLIKKYTISYAYSATLWSMPAIGPSSWQNQFAGFAPSYSQGLLANSRELEPYGNFRDRITSLRFTGDEIKNAVIFFPGSIFSDQKATEAAFKNLGGNYRIIHLAMHAIVDEQSPLQSKLIFAQVNDSTEDGFLNAWELYSMNINADLAVLSACNTGYGKLVNGEGVMSLSRAFSYAGCNSLVMSLWEADDKVTAEIMKLFYQYLSDGETKDAALRNAKLKYFEKADPLLSHPYFWAAFIANGDMKPVKTVDKNWFAKKKWWLLATGILLLSIGGYSIFRKKNKLLSR